MHIGTQASSLRFSNVGENSRPYYVLEYYMFVEFNQGFTFFANIHLSKIYLFWHISLCFLY